MNIGDTVTILGRKRKLLRPMPNIEGGWVIDKPVEGFLYWHTSEIHPWAPVSKGPAETQPCGCAAVSDQYDEGLPRMRWLGDIPPPRWAATKFPKETPMIDLDKPLYDQHGNRWHSLKGPDGHAFVTPESVAFLVSEGSKAFPASFDVKQGLFLSSIWNDYVLTNTPPKPDWDRTIDVDAHDAFKVRVGRRNGKLFAEVVE